MSKKTWEPGSTVAIARQAMNDNFTEVFGNIDSGLGLNILQAGANPDGVTDNTAILQNCINSLSSGGVLLIPQGVFLTGPLTVPSNVMIRGVNRDKSILKLKPSPTGPLLDLSGTFENDKTGIHIENLTLQHINTFNKVDELSGSLIKAVFSKNCTIRACVFENCSVNGIYIKWTDSNNTQSKSINISECIFRNFKKSGSRGIFLDLEAEYVRICNNRFETLGTAIESSDAANATVQNNVFLGCGNAGSYTVIVNSNTINNAGKMAFVDNKLNHSDGGGILINHVGGPKPEYGCIIKNNDILVGGGDAVRIVGAQGCIIKDNRAHYGFALLDFSGATKFDYNIVADNILIIGGINLDYATGTHNLISNNLTQVPL